MYEYAVTLQIQPHALPDALSLLRQQLTPLMSVKTGLLGLAYIPRRDENTITIISMWQSHEHAAAGEMCHTYRSLVARLDQYLLDATVFNNPAGKLLTQPDLTLRLN